MKSLVARCLASRVRDGEVLGLGSGTTVELAVDQIGRRIAREGLKVMGVPTSYRTALCARNAGITVLSSFSVPELAWAFDGADEVDVEHNLIKGRGAAMLPEKILAKQAKHFVIIVSEDKLVDNLGERNPIPIEIIPESLALVEKSLSVLGAREVKVRAAANKYGPVISEHNNLVLDAWFDRIEPEFEAEIKKIVGVVESGLFVGFFPEVLVAKEDGVWSRRLRGGECHEELILAVS